MKTLVIAMLCHAANAAYCRSLGDGSQVPWEKAPDWQKESAVKGVEFCLANPDAPPSANHDSWMAEKTKEGWVFGETKDPKAKPPTHPCMVPFDQLPATQQFKDVLFKTIVAGCASDDLPAELEAALAERDRASEAVATVQTQRDEAVAELEQLRTGLAELDLPGDLVTSTDSVAASALLTIKGLAARADKAEKAAKAAKAAKVSRGEAPAKPRALKPQGDDALSKEQVATAIDAAIADDKKVEIAFSDGKRELTQIPPISVEGMAWRDHSLGRMLAEPVTLTGVGNTSIGIHGQALLIDGKQVAYQSRSDQLNLAPGQKLTLDNDIFF